MTDTFHHQTGGWKAHVQGPVDREGTSTITAHVAVLVVLLFATARLRPPAADGLPFRKR